MPVSSHCQLPLTAAFFLLMCAGTFAAASAQPGVPLLTIGQTLTPPIIDAGIEAKEWAAASSPAEFISLATGSLPEAQPQVWVTWDADALYIAARLPLPPGKLPVAKTTQRDGNVWEDDAVEVFLDPTHSHGDYFQLIVNAKGVQFDARRQDASWNGYWQAETGVGRDHWEVQMRVPYVGLGLKAPKPGDVWGFNVAWDRQTPSPLIASWAHVRNGLHEPAAFGDLRFASEAPALQFTGPSGVQSGALQFGGSWAAALPLEAKLTVTQQTPAGPKEIASDTAVHGGSKAMSPLSLAAKLPKDGEFVRPGEYTVALKVMDRDDLVYLATAPVTVRPPLVLTLRRYLLEEQQVAVDVDASGNPRPPRDVRVNLLDPRGKRLDYEDARLDASGRGSVTFGVAKLPPGKYEVTASPARRMAPVKLPLVKPDPPAWLGSREGLSDAVQAPWTPVERTPTGAKVWGREYQFSSLPFPSSVTTAGAQVLAGPITLRMVVDGRELAWQQMGAPTDILTSPTRAVLGLKASGGLVDCSGKASVEYDGMVRSDVTLTPRGAKEIEHLSLVIPIREEYAKYLYHFPGQWNSSYNAGALPRDGFTAPFRPFIWLGDEERGFSWFSETDQGFFVADPGKVTEITRSQGVVTLRINMITVKRPVNGPMNFTFGFETTPVKPMVPDTWDYRICHQGGYGIEDQEWTSPATITYPAEGNIKLDRGTFEAWVRPHFDPNPDVKPDDASRGRFNRSLFCLQGAGGDTIDFYWNIDDRGMRLFYKQGEAYPLLMTTHEAWKAGEWHHVAFTWGDDKTCVYVDGQKVGETAHQGTIATSLQSAHLLLGTSGDPCEFDIDEVRISEVPRESFDLTQPCPADALTLLLDRLDFAAPRTGDGETTPVKGKAGHVVGGAAVNGKWGGAFGTKPEGKKMTVLDRLAELGVRTVVFHEHWTDVQNYTSTTHVEELRKLVAACHQHGIKLLLYFGYEMSNIAPEWDAYSDECLVHPQAGGYKRQPEQTAYIVCYHSKWQDFMAAGIARMMDQYDIDGVYLDGTEYPWGCANLHHGCGYRAPDGSLRPTYPFFGYRDMLRRIYTIVKSRKPDGEVNVHNSTCMTIPSLGWATSSWDGEQFGSIERGPNPLAVLPLDAFRAEFMGRQWGVPSEFLCYERPYTYSEAMSFTLLHDVLVRGSLGGSLEMESKLWKGMDAFGRRGAVWLPYWDNADYVKVGPDAAIKASVYSRAEAGAVVVVSNLGSEKKTATVQLKRDGLMLLGRLQATDMLTDQPVEIGDQGEMRFDLKPFAFRVVWVKPAK